MVINVIRMSVNFALLRNKLRFRTERRRCTQPDLLVRWVRRSFAILRAIDTTRCRQSSTHPFLTFLSVRPTVSTRSRHFTALPSALKFQRGSHCYGKKRCGVFQSSKIADGRDTDVASWKAASHERMFFCRINTSAKKSYFRN